MQTENNLKILIAYTLKVNQAGVQEFAQKRSIKTVTTEGIMAYLAKNPEDVRAFLNYHPDKEMLLEEFGNIDISQRQAVMQNPKAPKIVGIMGLSIGGLLVVLLMVAIIKIIRK